MVDKPDFNKLKNKFDISTIVDNLKTIIGSTSPLSDVNPNDALDQKIVAAHQLLESLEQQSAEFTKNCHELNRLLQGMFLDLQAIRQENEKMKTDNPSSTDI